MKIGSNRGGGGGRRLTEAELREHRIRMARAREIDSLVKELRDTCPRRKEVRITREKTPDTVLVGVRRQVDREFPVPDGRLITADLNMEELRSVMFRVTQALPETYETHVDLPGGLSLKQTLAGKWPDTQRSLQIVDGSSVVADLGADWYLSAPNDYSPTLEIMGRHLSEHVLPEDGTVVLVDKKNPVYGRAGEPLPREVRMVNKDKSLSDTYVVRWDGSVTGYRFDQPPLWDPNHRSIAVVQVSGRLDDEGGILLEDGGRLSAPVAPQLFWASAEGKAPFEALYSIREEGYTVEAAGSAVVGGPQIVEEDSWIMIADQGLEVRL